MTAPTFLDLVHHWALEMTEKVEDRKKIDDAWLGELVVVERVDHRGLPIPTWFDDGSNESDALGNVATMMTWRRGGKR